MKNILDIMRICNVDRPAAFRVFDRMCINEVDFSRCTNRTFRREALRALKEIV